MDAAPTLQAARRRAGLSQQQLAARAGTSQATISAYENGHKQPTVETFGRLLGAAATRLVTQPAERPVVHVSEAQLRRAGRTLVAVLELAAALPARHRPGLGYPRRLATKTERAA
jgi:transcriptional regulator with XRE-family HTH domain